MEIDGRPSDKSRRDWDQGMSESLEGRARGQRRGWLGRGSGCGGGQGISPPRVCGLAPALSGWVRHWGKWYEFRVC